MPEDGLQKPKEVGIEGRLIKHPRAEQISRGNPLSPFIIGPPVAGEMIKKRDGIDLKQVEKPQQECAAENDPEPTSIR
jgi:hypothetical protein